LETEIIVGGLYGTAAACEFKGAAAIAGKLATQLTEIVTTLFNFE